MTSREIRQAFLDFFASKGHKIIPSAPMVAKSDPTLMFVNSGMAPLKDFFLGNGVPPAPRVADTQKCLRVTGKHNDLEDVGRDGYHHTLFEMLGNWSFGDYFKEEAIAWSWELLTEVFKLPKDRLYVTVFEGDESEGLAYDQEAYDFWKKHIAEDRIIGGNKKDNFWEMGEQGPCGPCSEIHIDLRPDSERDLVDGKSLVNNDNPSVIEVWNNVFMQFNRKADRSLELLPAKSVDTGMGFERLCRAVQGVASNYDTDVFTPYLRFLEAYSGIKYTGTYPGVDEKWERSDVAMRVVADHLRAVTFAIADGELPSNTGAGYVIRRILRRAVRYYFSFLNIKEPIIYRMVAILSEEMGDMFPEVPAQVDFITRVILEEERSFLRTLDSGLRRFETLDVKNGTIDGAVAFELYDTFGFPIDLSRLIAGEKGLEIDEAGFQKALAEQRARSRQDAVKSVGDWEIVKEYSQAVEFVGYDQLETRSSQVVKYRSMSAKGVEQVQLVLDRTPFFPEGGGQVGDTGTMTFGEEKIQVLNTVKENDLIIHIVERIPRYISDPTVVCRVDAQRRRLTENNHSATHLMHAALRSVLGTHVQQRGSYLDNQALRFDFSHFQKLTDSEILQIEQIVNQKIRENVPLDERRNLPIAEAQAAGAMMLFGEKYGESVRMITFDPNYSRELCGGCHVQNTGKIGFFKITTETAVAAGVRRIEAITSVAAEAYVHELEKEVTQARNLLKTKDLPKAIADLQEQSKLLQKEVERLVMDQANALQGELRSQATNINGMYFIARKIPVQDANAVKTLAFNLEAEISPAVIAFGTVSTDGKPLLSLRISEALTKERGWNAGNIVRELAKKHLNGGGGGQAIFATAGGTAATGLDAALLEIEAMIRG